MICKINVNFDIDYNNKVCGIDIDLGKDSSGSEIN